MSQTPSSVARRFAVLHEIAINRPETSVESPFIGAEVDDPNAVVRTSAPSEAPPREELTEGRLRQLASTLKPYVRMEGL